MGLGAVFSGGLVGTLLQLRHQREVERDQRRERAAQVLADALALLQDLKPTANYRADEPWRSSDIAKLKVRREELRTLLLRVAVARRSPMVRKLERELSSALDSTLTILRWIEQEAAVNESAAYTMLDEAFRQHQSAERALDDLLKAI
jgi:hypothetical protein